MRTERPAWNNILRAEIGAGIVAIFAGRPTGLCGYMACHGSMRCSTPCIDAIGLACGRSHAVWSWPDQGAHEEKNGAVHETMVMFRFLAKVQN